MTNNTIQDQLTAVKLEIKAYDRTLYLLDKKTDRLEQTYEYQHEKLNDIEEKVDAIAVSLKEMSDKLSRHEGAAAFKAKLLSFFYTSLGAVGGFLSSDFFINKFFKN